MILSLRSITLTIIVSVMWIFGAIQLGWIFSNLAENWYWLAIATVYAITVNELFFHLVLGHVTYQIDPNRWAYKVLVFLTSTSLTSGSIKSMILLHDTHHLYADQDDRDYLSWRLRWMTSVSMSPLMFIYRPGKLEIPDFELYYQERERKFSHLINDPWTQFCDDHQIGLTIAFFTLLYLTVPTIFFNVIILGRLIISIAEFINTLGGHTKFLFGYRNFNTPDQSYNSLLTHYLWLGLFSAALHNNHHGMDTSTTHSSKWYEIDTGAWILNFILKPLLIKTT